MVRCGRTAQTAISILSPLAEKFDGGATRLSSAEISHRRNLPLPLVAKLLTQLSTARMVDGTRGPGGGYWLSRDPATVSLQEIVEVFEKGNDGLLCPFGPGWCGERDPCPLHDSLVALDRQWSTFLKDTNLGIFQVAPTPPQ
jgi:Rrf2 family transcriptional regulator, iron-sulfur cluster assembly transcription factor